MSSTDVGAVVVIALATAMTGCAGDQLDGPIEAEAAGWATFTRINRDPFRTAMHQGNPMVNVWTNPAATAPYRALSAGGAPAARLPVGAMVVKEMMDGAGGPPILTVMAKQPPGYDLDHGDWWYGRLETDGSATSAAFVGRVGFCVGCHDGAAATDHLFGVDAANLAPATSARAGVSPR